MGMTGIRFNIFNIIVSSFIFGLGVDYSILMMRGLQNALRTGRYDLSTTKTSILISSLTTLFGVGALFFTRHPALRSIALISTIGILIVVITTFVLQPAMYRVMIYDRVKRNKFPVTLVNFIKTIVTWGNIVLIALILMIVGAMINILLPVKRAKKEAIFHYLFNRLSKAYISFTFAFDQKLINEPGEDFSKPAIIISNHQSLIETPAFLRLHPKIQILTTSWVYRSPVFGPVARLANYVNSDGGIEDIVDQLKTRMDDGFSILIFPEGHRSPDHHIQRFHRGAFYLAEKLHADILPVVVFGTGEFLGKGAFWGHSNGFRMKILNRVAATDHTFGSTYQERTKQFRKYYIRQYAEMRATEGDARYYRRLLALNYVLKGPVLEWYMRIKMHLEDYYDLYVRLMPREGNILDLGCGYGFISYMLMFTSEFRCVTGVDYDAEKIGVAENCFSKNARISFTVADVGSYEITPNNGFLLSDVLHYLQPEKQAELLRSCCRNLLPGGTILIREANAELAQRHKRSKLTELFSTHSGFNKTSGPAKELWFTTAATIEAVVTDEGLCMEVIDTKRVTSNNLFVIRHSAIG
jgi:1-acyl-sn-glycerol-3-phosphate acyltransferase